MNPKLEETIYVDFVTSSPTTGAATDADSTPTAEVFEDNTDTAIITPTVTKRTGKTGNYRVPVVCSAANGFETSKSYNIVVAATVGAVAAKAVIRTFQMRTRSVDDLPLAGAAMTLTSAYDPAKTCMQVGTAVTVGINNDKTGYALTSAYDASKTASSQTSVDGVKSSTDHLATAMELDGSVYRFTTNALEQAPTGAGGTGGATPDQVQEQLVIYGAAKPGSQMSLLAAYDAAKTAATQASVDAIKAVVDAVKAIDDKLNSTLELDGSVYRFTTNALEQAPTGTGGGGGATDWTASEREQIRSRLGLDGTQTVPAASNPLATQATSLAIKAKTDNLPADPASASTINTSFVTVNAKLDAIDDYVDTEVAAIKGKTDNLPSDPASANTINSAFSTVNGKLDTINGYVDTEVAAIKAKTDQLSFTTGRVDANASLAMTVTDLNNIADAVLKRDWVALTGEAAYSLLNAARMLRNVWDTTGGTLHVKKEDGATLAWQRPLTVDPAAQPIVGAS